MSLYFFDSHDNCQLLEDDIGLIFADLETVKIEAARALADLAADVLPGSERRELTIAVRDEAGKPVLKTVMVFEIVVLADILRFSNSN